jgi:hypothetical protein
MAGRALVFAASALAAGGLAAWAVWGAGASGTPHDGQPPGEPLTATGYVPPGALVAGHSVPLTAEVYNSNYYGVTLSAPEATGVEPVTVRTAGTCRAGDVVFRAVPRLSARIDPWTSRAVPAGTLTMRPGASAACAHAGFQVALSFTTRVRPN